jgi:5-methylcytosine-specific restriction endonuclease McrA
MNIVDVIRIAYDWRKLWEEHGHVDYYKYIRSPKWRRISREAKERAGWKCQVCNGTDRVQTHHRTYVNLGHEKPEDLFVLCDECHELFSKNGRLAK